MKWTARQRMSENDLLAKPQIILDKGLHPWWRAAPDEFMAETRTYFG